ncbi:hypothetical protein OIU74_012977 [Salix koriyanagi]|uniref:Uncharacterized protein n=1 Tax=Salix koriyanagi TaxID=2511006 RepID=A0A9Q0Q810_9ROSI|nr:hypothetical protein OIU74_012977 [Salix koriyanagi]
MLLDLEHEYPPLWPEDCGSGILAAAGPILTKSTVKTVRSKPFYLSLHNSPVSLISLSLRTERSRPLLGYLRFNHSMASQSSPQSVHDLTVKEPYGSGLLALRWGWAEETGLQFLGDDDIDKPLT